MKGRCSILCGVMISIIHGPWWRHWLKGSGPTNHFVWDPPSRWPRQLAKVFESTSSCALPLSVVRLGRCVELERWKLQHMALPSLRFYGVRSAKSSALAEVSQVDPASYLLITRKELQNGRNFFHFSLLWYLSFLFFTLFRPISGVNLGGGPLFNTQSLSLSPLEMMRFWE